MPVCNPSHTRSPVQGADVQSAPNSGSATQRRGDAEPLTARLQPRPSAHASPCSQMASTPSDRRGARHCFALPSHTSPPAQVTPLQGSPASGRFTHVKLVSQYIVPPSSQAWPSAQLPPGATRTSHVAGCAAWLQRKLVAQSAPPPQVSPSDAMRRLAHWSDAVPALVAHSRPLPHAEPSLQSLPMPRGAPQVPQL